MRATIRVSRKPCERSWARTSKRASTVPWVELSAKLKVKIEDARATMRLFMNIREEYESGLAHGKDVVAALPT